MGCFHSSQCPGSPCRAHCSFFGNTQWTPWILFIGLVILTSVMTLKCSHWDTHQVWCSLLLPPPGCSGLHHSQPSLSARICLPLASPPSFPCLLRIRSRASSSKRPPVVPDSFTLLSRINPGRKTVPSQFRITKLRFLSSTFWLFHPASP